MSSNRNNKVNKVEKEKNFFDKIEDTLNDIVEPFAKTKCPSGCYNKHWRNLGIIGILAILFFVGWIFFMVFKYFQSKQQVAPVVTNQVTNPVTNQVNNQVNNQGDQTTNPVASMTGGRYSLNDISITSL